MKKYSYKEIPLKNYAVFIDVKSSLRQSVWCINFVFLWNYWQKFLSDSWFKANKWSWWSSKLWLNRMYKCKLTEFFDVYNELYDALKILSNFKVILLQFNVI